MVGRGFRNHAKHSKHVALALQLLANDQMSEETCFFSSSIL